MGPEAKFYQNVKQNFKQFSLIRLENISLLGTPDLLVCNTFVTFNSIVQKFPEVLQTNKSGVPSKLIFSSLIKEKPLKFCLTF